MNILDFIFPKRCVECGRLGQYICAQCKKQIIAIAPNECICPVCEKPAIAGITHPRCRTKYTPDGLTSFFYYKDVVRSAIAAIKYRFVSDLASEFVGLVPFSGYEIRSLIGSSHTILVPIPLHYRRLNYRGFNQSETLGSRVATTLQIPIVANALRRTRETPPQVHMKDKSARKTNMQDVFEMSTSFIHNSNIATVLLFDDVFTTGATMREAASMLKRQGIPAVWCVTMAR